MNPNHDNSGHFAAKAMSAGPAPGAVAGEAPAQLVTRPAGARVLPRGAGGRKGLLAAAGEEVARSGRCPAIRRTGLLAPGGLTPKDPDYFTPQRLKAWALVESGGHPKDFASDPFQVKSDDWDDEKAREVYLFGETHRLGK